MLLGQILTVLNSEKYWPKLSIFPLVWHILSWYAAINVSIIIETRARYFSQTFLILTNYNKWKMHI
jgi:hypothetical protein